MLEFYIILAFLIFLLSVTYSSYLEKFSRVVFIFIHIYALTAYVFKPTMLLFLGSTGSSLFATMIGNLLYVRKNGDPKFLYASLESGFMLYFYFGLFLALFFPIANYSIRTIVRVISKEKRFFSKNFIFFSFIFFSAVGYLLSEHEFNFVGFDLASIFRSVVYFRILPAIFLVLGYSSGLRKLSLYTLLFLIMSFLVSVLINSKLVILAFGIGLLLSMIFGGFRERSFFSFRGFVSGFIFLNAFAIFGFFRLVMADELGIGQIELDLTLGESFSVFMRRLPGSELYVFLSAIYPSEACSLGLNGNSFLTLELFGQNSSTAIASGFIGQSFWGCGVMGLGLNTLILLLSITLICMVCHIFKTGEGMSLFAADALLLCLSTIVDGVNMVQIVLFGASFAVFIFLDLMMRFRSSRPAILN